MLNTIRLSLIPTLLAAFALLSYPEARGDDPVGEWVKVGTEEGISVYRKEVKDDPVYAYRGEGTLQASLGKIITVSRDVPRQTEWVNRLRTAKVLREITPMHRIIYLRVSTPWPVSDRDFVIDSELMVDRVKKTAVFKIHSVEDELAPVNSCCVRGQVHYNRIELKAVPSNRGDATQINAEAHVDPKGSLPTWIVNRIQRTFPRKSIEGILRQVAKPDIVDYFAVNLTK